MKKKSAVEDLMRWRIEHRTFNHKKGRLQDDFDFLSWVYSDVLVDQLIERIRCAPESKPTIHVLREMHQEFDDVLSNAKDDHALTFRFAGIMEMMLADILRRWEGENRR